MQMTNLDDLLAIAIQEEINAQKFYMDVREKTSDRKIRDFLQAIIREEQNHEKTLKSIRALELFDGSLTVNAEMLEAAQQAHRIAIPESLNNLSLEDLFEIALKKEAQAYTMYDHIAQTTVDEEIKSLFNNMADEERNHHKKINEFYLAKTGQMGYEG
jgi:rubrerythrin